LNGSLQTEKNSLGLRAGCLIALCGAYFFHFYSINFTTASE